MPEKPIKAIAKMPAVSKAMGTPCMAFGTLVSANCSRILEKMSKAIE